MTQSQQEQIEAYLLGTLSPEARLEFDRELESDPALVEALQFHHKMIHGIEEVGFRTMLDDIHTRGGGRVLPWYQQPRFLSIAAAILLLVGFAWWWLPQRQPADQWASIELAPGLPTTLGPAEDLAFSEGMNAYKLGNYPEADAYWLPLLKDRPKADTLLFFLGQTALAQKQDSVAIARLDQVRQQATSPWRVDAAWYLALAHLRLEDEAAARLLLEELVQTPNNRRQAAQTLLESLQP